MTLRRPYSLLLAVPVFCAASAVVMRGQQPAVSQVSASPQNQAPAAAAKNANATLTEDGLRTRFVGKMVFLRGAYVGDDLNFDLNGKVVGSPGTTSFTLAALEIRKIHLSKRKLEIEADRYALHFNAALPYGNDNNLYDKVKISQKPVHISIERELVIVPKEKKEKEKKGQNNSKPSPGPSNPSVPTGSAVAAASPAPSAASSVLPSPAEAETTTSPAHSAMLLNAALDQVFATDIDQRMMTHLPDYWQEYFKSKLEHHEFIPADAHVLEVGGDVAPPKVLNSIDPSSNEFAQKYGIAGLTLFRTVVDAEGRPEQIAIARPIGFGLDEKAVEAIKSSRFKPAMKDGHPVPVVIDVVVTFRIYSNRTKPGSVTKKSKETQVVASAWDSDSSKQAP